MFMLRRVVLRDTDTSEWLIFSKPVDVLLAKKPQDVLTALSEAERRVNEEALFAVGFVCYEAASGFDSTLVTRPGCQLPLLCFGLFRKPVRSKALPVIAANPDSPLMWTMSQPRDAYRQSIAAIKQQIALGNTYQINYTVRQETSGINDSWALFVAIATEAPFAAFIECEHQVIVSASPELFFRLHGEDLLAKPMKGTAARGLTSFEDIALRNGLHQSAKNRAENVMITDMLRSDIGRIAVPGSVKVPTLLEIEKYPTVWQMTSTVSAHTSAPVSEIFQALFPCASVTGAPKVSSMKIIAELESTARGIYTGAIGFISPGRRAQFSVAIRTALIDTRTGEGIYGVGGGIVWDSDADEEYRECQAKARILKGNDHSGSFELLETLLWKPAGGYSLLQQHLQRLRASADYFDFEFDGNLIEDALSKRAKEWADEPRRVRLLLQRDGQFRISDTTVDKMGSELRLTLSPEPIDRSSPFLYHKTTRRDVYEKALSAAASGNDVLFWNSDRLITETSIANVIVQIGGQWYTPPIECGLLPGTYRESLLNKGEIEERKIHLDELAPGQEIILINSVRGRYKACLD
ncbi:MAG: aminodeoxychorismate synthase component I [Gammaproteobacteria bacterium]|nr:aminodeoxychorismate synthase component I [Gammaproteobacteria bacterium]